MAWEELRSSLWFLPGVIVSAYVALAVLLVELDALIGAQAFRNFPRLFGAEAEGTRGMLEAIASAMITVAGVTFSVTIVALSLTSSQYSPRVLRNFMGDRSNQVVLGAFVGLYAYCLVVLRTIRSGEADPFVPSIATLAAIVLALVGIALLIHFIHHVSASIQAAHIVAAIHEETSGAIDRLYPDRLGEPRDGPDAAPPPATERATWTPVPAERSGYVQGIDAEKLLHCAEEREAVVHLACRPGDFVREGEPLAYVDARGKGGEPPGQLAKAVTVGNQRTLRQDVAFGIRQLVDVALKALSPSINDPTTAVMCLDRLWVLLAKLAGRRKPSPYRTVHGTLRVVAPAYDFAELLVLALEEIRLAAAPRPVVLGRIVDILDALLAMDETRRERRALLVMAARVAESVQALDDEPQRRELSARLARIAATSRGSDRSLPSAARSAPWRR